MNDELGETQPLINNNTSDGCRPPVYSSHQFPVDECRCYQHKDHTASYSVHKVAVLLQ